MSCLLDIVGQDGALAQLQRTLQGGRRPQSFLFLGPEGVGRRTTAQVLARLLLCEHPRRQANAKSIRELPDDFSLLLPCDQCPSCRTAEAGTNPDLLIVHRQLARFHDDASVRSRVMQDLGIDVIRQFLLDPAYRTSTGGHGRVFIVREAELMSVPAQNALLKTLEEPPAGVSIILLAPSAEELLPTTRSRCQAVQFRPLDREFVAGKLTGQGIPAAEARFWAELTEGSLGRALRLAGQGQYAFKCELVEALAALSSGGEGEAAEMLNKATDSQAAKLTKADDQLAATLANRQAGQAILTLVVSLYRDALSLACGQARPLVHADQAEAVARIAQRFGVDGLTDILAQLARYEELLWRNVNAKLLWDNVAITCATAAAFEVDA
jgi:DNA polymerase III subunit delta'